MSIYASDNLDIKKDVELIKSCGEYNISNREATILAFLLNDYKPGEIADKLFVSKKTIYKHRENILAKFNCRTLFRLAFLLQGVVFDSHNKAKITTMNENNFQK